MGFLLFVGRRGPSECERRPYQKKGRKRAAGEGEEQMVETVCARAGPLSVQSCTADVV